MQNIYFGDRGTLVKYVQLALGRAGYVIAVDGILGRKTCEALWGFLGQETECIITREIWQKLEPYLRGYAGKAAVKAAQNAGEQKEGQNFDFSLVPGNAETSSMLTDYIVEGLAARYPFLETGSIGKSVMGKNIPYLKIGNGKKQIFYNASFHANENITTPVLLKFAEEYATAYARRENLYRVPAVDLFEEYSLYLVPLVNPDGVDLVNGILTNGSYYRQAKKIAEDFPGIPFPSGWKANIEGIDLNLQFPAGWENAKRIKYEQGFDKPAPRDYVGRAPLVAPESRAVYEFTQAHDFSLILAYHTQGEVIYWKYLDYEPERSREIALYFGKVSGYTVEETPMQSGYAGYKDWFIQEYNRPGYTIEAGMGENPLPMSQFEKIYRDNIGILMGGMTQI